MRPKPLIAALTLCEGDIAGLEGAAPLPTTLGLDGFLAGFEELFAALLLPAAFLTAFFAMAFARYRSYLTVSQRRLYK